MADVLAAALGAVRVVVGEDYRFGVRAEGDVDALRELGGRYGFEVAAQPLLRIEGERVSSSWIRELVAKGEVSHAARLLGRDPWLDGWVVRGDGRGRELGVPTANLAMPPGRVRPAIGVYAGWAEVQGERTRRGDLGRAQPDLRRRAGGLGRGLSAGLRGRHLRPADRAAVPPLPAPRAALRDGRRPDRASMWARDSRRCAVLAMAARVHRSAVSSDRGAAVSPRRPVGLGKKPWPAGVHAAVEAGSAAGSGGVRRPVSLEAR